MASDSQQGEEDITRIWQGAGLPSGGMRRFSMDSHERIRQPFPPTSQAYTDVTQAYSIQGIAKVIQLRLE